MWSVRIVYHAVVLESIQFLSFAGMYGVVEVRDDSLDRLTTPKVAYVGPTPPSRGVVALG